MKKLTLTLVIAAALAAGLAHAGSPASEAKGETHSCDNHSGACGALNEAESATLEAGAVANAAAFEQEVAGCDVHSGACGAACGAAGEASVSRGSGRSYEELQAEIDRLLAVIDFEG